MKSTLLLGSLARVCGFVCLKYENIATKFIARIFIIKIACNALATLSIAGGFLEKMYENVHRFGTEDPI